MLFIGLLQKNENKPSLYVLMIAALLILGEGASTGMD